MPRVTVSIDDEDKDYLQEQSGDSAEYDSMSEVMRECIQAHKEQNELENEIERLRNEKRVLLEQRQEATEIQRYIREERTYRNAGLRTRLKWWLLGKPEEDQ